jgi:hypothetical protein
MGMMTRSLRALLANLIDYAGLYPPAALPVDRVAENYKRYLDLPESWMLNRLVLPLSKLKEFEVDRRWRITLLVDDEPGSLPEQVETFETKGVRLLLLPTYCEAPLDQVRNAFAKVRTGGLTPDAIPSSHAVADFLLRAAARRIPFKATAGLHHPIRSEQALTYAADSPRAVMHGFVNVFIAAALAWHGMDRALLLEVLNETSPSGFEFHEGGLGWRGHRLSTTQIETARRDFAHSFGSCSFDEPVADLRKLGWL